MIKYPEEIKQAEILKNLERLEAKLRRRKGKAKAMEKCETSTDAPKDKIFFMDKDCLYVNKTDRDEWEKLSERPKEE